jgi:tetratricopeptide (TPR) repeat protein
LALQYALRGDDARALPLLQHVIGLGLDNYEVRFRVGVSLYNLKRFDEANSFLRSALSLSTSAAEPHYYLGLSAWAQGHDEQAADLWDQAVTLRPNFPEAYFMLGEALRKNHRLQASVDFYKRALDQDATKFVYYARLGGAHIVLGEPDRAIEVFHRATARFPKLAEAHYFAGIAARAGADYANAEVELRKSLTLAPKNVNALAQLGFVLLERDQLKESEAALRQAIRINDQHFYANYDLGRLLVKSLRYQQAIPVLQHAVSLKPNNPSAHYQLFMALSRLKRKEEARQELAIFKQLDEARKARPRGEADVDDDDAENPSQRVPPK